MQSKLLLSTKLTSQGKTQLDQYFVSPPFKVMTLPVYDDAWQSGLNAMQMSSSPGLLAGDLLDIEISLADDTSLSLNTQAFTRVQSMNDGDYATQKTCIKLGKNSRLFYLPHPLVLHKDSGFKQTTEIEMGEQSELIYGEIVAIGRVLNGERFAFRHFASYLRISHQNRPLVTDRIQWLPAKIALTSLSQMEDFSHQGSLTYINLAKTALEIKAIVNELQESMSEQKEMLIGVSQLNDGGLMVRVLAHRADIIQHLFERIGQVLKAQSNIV
ncbi:urease accessory protein UreD [Actinobacillus genomosp. 2]|uniref:urease accessory protein UreD n=1 Tax=Actinobacillus genomosp. 2 TaxID=230709 RepID=UPI002442AECD|nr:urease accessory protein UreD [Actinobacillus genomosp. 2]WGE31671.1 urease accessory protein UreD [Actinobacillus genomosp. 2]